MVLVQSRSTRHVSACLEHARYHWISLLLLICGAHLALSASNLASSAILSIRAVKADCVSAKASACGDPHFKGFDGRSFDFQGHADGNYNLISEQEHQLNAKFIADPVNPEGLGTWLGEVLLKFKDDVVHMHVLASGRLSVQVNQGPLNTPPGSILTRHTLPSGTRLSYRHRDPSDPASDERVILVTPSMSLAVQVTGKQYNHLDLLILAISPYLCDVHGVLGQSYKRMQTRRATLAAGTFIEGADWDYELPDLRSDSFTFNRFKLADGGGCMGGGGSTRSSISTAYVQEMENSMAEAEAQAGGDEDGEGQAPSPGEGEVYH